jgi:hypothetical protein
MNTARLAAKQKRIKDLSTLLKTYVSEPEIYFPFKIKLEEYSSLLHDIWEAKDVEISDTAWESLRKLERELDTFCESARLRPLAGRYA